MAAPTFSPMSYETIVANWDTPQAVDWGLVYRTLGRYLREVIATFSRQNPAAVVYGMVIVHGQNWELSVHLNTEEGYGSMPARFRTQSNWPARTDAELLDALGRWYYDAWEFGLYEFECQPEVNAVNNVHYKLFDRLSTHPAASGEVDLPDHFLHACALAVAILESSPELRKIRRTADFEIRFFDANRHEWDTAFLMEAARRQAAGEGP
ncbi:MAG: hypothetical protein V4726_02990 [Verrucomicrobiota bacterium]